MALRTDLTAGDLGHITDHEELAATVLTKAAAGAIYAPTVVAQLVADGVADDTAALSSAADLARSQGRTLVISGGTVRLTATVNLRYIDVVSDATLVADHDGLGVIVGDASATRARRSVRLGPVRRGTGRSATLPALRILGVQNGDFEMNGAQSYVQLYADVADPTAYAIAYSTFRFTGGIVSRLQLYGEVGTSYINDNLFIGGDFKRIDIDAVDYQHNGNVWVKPVVEGSSSVVNILRGSRNLFLDLRGEGGGKVTFGADASRNLILDNFTSNDNVRGPGLVVLSDLGLDNAVRSRVDDGQTVHDLVRVDNQSVMFDASSEHNTQESAVPGFKNLRLRSAGQTIFDTGIVPVENLPTNYENGHRLRRLVFESSNALWRPRLFGYDANGVLVDPAITPFHNSTGGWIINGAGFYTFGSNVSFARILLTNPDVVKFVRVQVIAASTAGASFSYARLYALLPKPQTDTPIRAFHKALSRPLFQSTSPTQGLAKVGQSIANPTGFHVATTRVDTTIATAAASGATSVVVASSTGMAVGDVIGVLMDTDQTHWTTVASIAGTTVGLTVALTAAAAVGRQVGTNKWITVT